MKYANGIIATNDNTNNNISGHFHIDGKMCGPSPAQTTNIDNNDILNIFNQEKII